MVTTMKDIESKVRSLHLPEETVRPSWLLSGSPPPSLDTVYISHLFPIMPCQYKLVRLVVNYVEYYKERNVILLDIPLLQ